MREVSGGICIVEDDASTGVALQRLIEALGYEASLYRSAREFFEDDKYKSAACVLLDVHLPDLDGLQIQEKLQEDGNVTPILFLTGTGDVPMSVRAMRAGAVDFLLKPVEENTLVNALAQAIRISQSNAEEKNRHEQALDLIASLTPREREVFCAVLTGAMNKQIAGHLGIAEKTVKIHRAQVMQKLRVRTIVELIAIANLCGVSANPILKR